MPIRLTAVGGPLTGAAIPLIADETSVGRDQSNVIVLADPRVSPCHCVIACAGGGVAIHDLDAANPSFVNGLPARDASLADGDEIQIGGSLFVLNLTSAAEPRVPDSVSVNERPPLGASTMTLHREEVFAGGLHPHKTSVERLSRDLDALLRITAAISAIRGLVALERPVLELIADVVPATRGAIVLTGPHPTEISSAIGWSREPRHEEPMPIGRPVIERVLRDAVGVLTSEDAHGVGARGPKSVLAAPLVALDKVIGAIVLDADAAAASFDEGHLRLLMAIAGVAATALEHARQVESLEGANRQLQAEMNLEHNMVGDCAPMREVYRRVARVAPTESTVLITGESGTGKELVARAIHRNSPRAERPFIAINCAAITETLLESELFGHERGAFTGAVAQKKGKLESAEGGTVFLDEIGELSLSLQAKLLRVLQEREFDRVGGTRRVRVDFRLVAATNRDLAAAIENGEFRRDLYYRLNVVSLAMPPLRERRDDIPLLANWFIRRHAGSAKRPIGGFSPAALACLIAYDWPGNVRELENAIEHALVLGLDEFVLPDDLPEAVAEATASTSSAAGGGPQRFHDAVKQAKKDLIVRAVEEANGNYNGAARLLGLHPNYLHRLIKNLQLKSVLKDK